MNKKWPTLFKKTNTGKIAQWSIEVQTETGCALIITTYGQVDGKLQQTSDTITSGKNEGKANATNYTEQAISEAAAKWTKQKKKGYVESIEAAQDGEVDEVIGGGVEPMLAPSKIYPTFAKKLTFPVWVDPKFDGSRMIAIVEDGVAKLWSRTRKRINSLPHIEAALEEQFPYGSYIFDGEAYVHSLNNDFEELMSLIRKDYPGEGHEVIEYHIYDLPSCKKNFNERNEALLDLDFKLPLVRVRRKKASNHEKIMALHEKNLENGFEGSMVRGNGPYESGKRSYFLQKLKNFTDDEFKVIGAEEGRGKDAGTVGAFVCVTKDGKEFKARLKATYARRTELFQNPKEWKGAWLTVA